MLRSISFLNLVQVSVAEEDGTFKVITEERVVREEEIYYNKEELLSRLDNIKSFYTDCYNDAVEIFGDEGNGNIGEIEEFINHYVSEVIWYEVLRKWTHR